LNSNSHHLSQKSPYYDTSVKISFILDDFDILFAFSDFHHSKKSSKLRFCLIVQVIFSISILPYGFFLLVSSELILVIVKYHFHFLFSHLVSKVTHSLNQNFLPALSSSSIFDFKISKFKLSNSSIFCL